MPGSEEIRYARLEAGARFLAAESGCGDARDAHLGMAAHYARRLAAAMHWRKG